MTEKLKNEIPAQFIRVETGYTAFSPEAVRESVLKIQEASTRVGLHMQAKFVNVTCYFAPGVTIAEETISDMIELAAGYLVIDGFYFYS
jgi:hypothetical protein